jgi:hypothetical protein
VALAVGGVGLAGGHYIPGTIVGVAALITAVNHPMPRAVPAPGPVPVPVPVHAGPEAQPQYAQLQYAQPQFAAAEYAAPAPDTNAAAAVTAPQPELTPAPFTGVRAMNILPGR